jgi:hypothetical protein
MSRRYGTNRGSRHVASHARGRRFETRRAHFERPRICGVFVVVRVIALWRVNALNGVASAQWCPINAVHERLEALLRVLLTAHRVGVDAQGEGRVCVPQLHVISADDRARPPLETGGLAAYVKARPLHLRNHLTGEGDLDGVAGVDARR